MIIFLLLCYVAVLFALIKAKVLPDTTLVKVSPLAFMLLLLLFLFIPMQWGAPFGPVTVVRHSVQIVPNVAGQVIDVPVKANKPLKKGDVLFRIDPTQYRSKVDQLAAQLKLAELRLSQYTQLERRNAGSRFQVEEAEANARGLRAQISDAKWQLEKTTVTAPSDGYVTALALRPGARVTPLPLAPVMAFIDTSETIIGAQLAQANVRYVEPGQKAEITFKSLPGQVFEAIVVGLIPAISSGQIAASGTAIAPIQMQPTPFLVRLRLTDQKIAAELPAGSFGKVAIYTKSMQATHIIRRIMIRMQAWMNYIVPF